MPTSVKHIHSGMRGAPQISGTAGTLIAALDALFVTGWGLTTAVSVNVAGGIATAQLTPGETFDRDAVVLVAGATPGALNGEARVLSTSNTSITWATTAPDGAASGAITIRYAPQTSWSKVYAATNKAVYRSTHVQSAGHYLRIDDTGTTTARVRGYETLADVDTGTGPFPTEAMMAGGSYLWKSQVASATAVKYRIYCDERFIIFAIAAGSVNGSQYTITAPHGFGDPIALAPSGDAWCTLLSAGGSTIGSPAGSNLANGAVGGTIGLISVPRVLSGLGGGAQVDSRPFVGVESVSGSDNALGALPSEVDGQVKYSRMFVRDLGTNKPPRAVVPGVLYVPQENSILLDGDKLDGAGDFAGRKLLVIGGPGGQYNQTTSSVYLVDVTGPWR